VNTFAQFVHGDRIADARHPDEMFFGMITFNSVSKTLGKGRTAKIVLSDINWTIPRNTQIVILGQRGSGKSTLLGLVAGISNPTSGWITRHGTISTPNPLRHGSLSTLRKLISRLSRIYRADPSEVIHCVSQIAEASTILDIPLRYLPRGIRSQLNLALTYALPCDLYLFDGAISAGQDPHFRTNCRRLFDGRRRDAGTIVATSTSRVAREFQEGARIGVLYQGALTFYEYFDDGIMVFDSLPQEQASTSPIVSLPDAEEDEEEVDTNLIV